MVALRAVQKVAMRAGPRAAQKAVLRAGPRAASAD
jgi:hypothetical protein